MAYAHPGDSPAPGMSAQLSAADLAWLTRLPTDPASMSLEDGRVLAGMSGALPAGSADTRLVDSIWLPLNDFHDAAHAVHDPASRTPTEDTADPDDPAAVAELLASVPDVLLMPTARLSVKESDAVIGAWARALGIAEPTAEQIDAERTAPPTPSTPPAGAQGRAMAARRFGTTQAPPADGPGAQGRAQAVKRFGTKPSPGK